MATIFAFKGGSTSSHVWLDNMDVYSFSIANFQPSEFSELIASLKFFGVVVFVLGDDVDHYIVIKFGG